MPPRGSPLESGLGAKDHEATPFVVVVCCCVDGSAGGPDANASDSLSYDEVEASCMMGNQRACAVLEQYLQSEGDYYEDRSGSGGQPWTYRGVGGSAGSDGECMYYNDPDSGASVMSGNC